MERYRKIFPNCWYLAEEGASGSAASGPAHLVYDVLSSAKCEIEQEREH